MTTEPYKDPFDLVEDKMAQIKDWTMPVPMSESTLKTLHELITDYTKAMVEKLDEKDVEAAVTAYAERLGTVYRGHWLRGEYSKVFTKEESDFKQYVDSENGPLRIQGQAVNPKSATTGPSAIIALQNMMGVGRPTRIPLWNSGVVLTVGNFRESEMLSLNHALNEQRVELGYATQGFLFTGNDVKIVMGVVDFILDHVIATNIKDWIKGDKSVLKELILVSDIQALCAGSLESIYPSGYPTEHSCVNTGTDKCSYKGGIKMEIGNLEFSPDSLLRFSRTIWTDTARIDIEAKRHMAAPAGTHPIATIRAYQTRVNTADNLSGVIKVNDAQIRLSYQQPNLKTYEEVGLYWITSVVDMVDKTMSAVKTTDREDRAKKRRGFISDYEHILQFQKQAAWIKSIQYGVDLSGDDVTVVNDIKTIFNLLEELSQNPGVVKEATADVNRYKTDTQLSFAGIPNFKCPSCGDSQLKDDVDNKHGIIPMDMVSYFFTIMEWRLARIAMAQMEIT